MLQDKVIISCAVTGAIHTPSMSPYLPVTASEIASSALEAAEAGAAIVHLHARNPETGQPDQEPELFRPFLEVASLNMGTMGFGLFPMLKRYKDFKHDWEAKALEASRDLVFKNTYSDIERLLGILSPLGIKFEFECYDTSHLYNLAHFLDRKLVTPPLFVQTVFGILGGIGAHPDDVMHMKRTADRLFGDQYRWSVLGAGARQMPIVAMAAAMGGNVRVGLEDSLWAGKGRLARSNAEQVRAARQIIEGLGLAVASAAEARQILALKGGDRTAI
jgi:uncharacterized protein (DUF849 family)